VAIRDLRELRPFTKSGIPEERRLWLFYVTCRECSFDLLVELWVLWMKLPRSLVPIEVCS
jgi:hypothetical protein